MTIEVRGVTKTFGRFTALDGVSLLVHTGDLVALLGPSGSGKTTLLRIIAGLEIPDPGEGSVLFEDKDAPDAGSPRVGFVFQHYALFRHMTVFDNVAFGLRVLRRRVRPPRVEIRRRVEELLALVQLEGLAGRFPSQLSGGQRQRVALARALAIQPKVLLLDEPFGALDAKVRQELRRWLKGLHHRIQLTSVFVTHDQEEAMELADRIVVMNAGRIEQQGTPDEVFHRPATEFVVNFLGQVNLFHGRVEAGKAHFGNMAVEWPAWGNPEGPVRVFVRPHDFDLDLLASRRPSFRAKVERIHSAGPVVKLQVLADSGERVDVEIDQDRFKSLRIVSGSQVYVSPKEIKVFFEDYSI